MQRGRENFGFESACPHRFDGRVEGERWRERIVVGELIVGELG